MNEIFFESMLFSRRQVAFGDASALYGYRFERDNGSVSQMTQARKYVDGKR